MSSGGGGIGVWITPPLPPMCGRGTALLAFPSAFGGKFLVWHWRLLCSADGLTLFSGVTPVHTMS